MGVPESASLRDGLTCCKIGLVGYTWVSGKGMGLEDEVPQKVLKPFLCAHAYRSISCNKLNVINDF